MCIRDRYKRVNIDVKGASRDKNVMKSQKWRFGAIRPRNNQLHARFFLKEMDVGKPPNGDFIFGELRPIFYGRNKCCITILNSDSFISCRLTFWQTICICQIDGIQLLQEDIQSDWLKNFSCLVWLKGILEHVVANASVGYQQCINCLLYTSDAADE